MLATAYRAALVTAACTRPRGALLIRAQMVSSFPPQEQLPQHLADMVDDLISGDAQLFDVREPVEAANGKLSASLLVPLSELQDGSKPPHDTATLTYVHCAAGVRVHPASAILSSMGFERVVPLQEGFATLANLGFEVE